MGAKDSEINVTENSGVGQSEQFFGEDELLLDDFEPLFDDNIGSTENLSEVDTSNIVLFSSEEVMNSNKLDLSLVSIDVDQLIEKSTMQDEEIDEIQEIQGMITDLQNRGYTNIEELDYVELSDLLTRDDEICEAEKSNVITDGICAYIDTIYSSLVSSKATFYKTDISKADFRIGDVQRPKGIPDSVADNILKIISNPEYLEVVSSYSDEDTVKNVIEILKRVGLITEDLLVQSEASIYNYVSTLIPLILANKDNQNKKINVMKHQRAFTGNILLKDFIKMKDIYQKGDFAFVRQIFAIGDSLFYKCPVCGSLEELPKTFINVLLFPCEGSNSFPTGKGRLSGNFWAFVILQPLECSCGKRITFILSDQNKIKNFGLNYIKSRAKDVSAAIENFGKGSSLLTLKLPTRVLLDAAPELIFNTAGLDGKDFDEANSKQESRKDAMQSIAIDDLEFLEAVKRFYVYIDSFSYEEDTSNESVNNSLVTGNNTVISSSSVADSKAAYSVSYKDTISYKEVAMFFASCLSKKYEKIKNQAIFTLLSLIEESAALSFLYDREELWYLENQISLLHSVNSKTRVVRPEFYQSLYDCYNALRPHEVNMEDFYNDESIRNKVINYLFDNENVISERITYLKKCTENAVSYLRDNAEVLGYTKIMNINQYSFQTFSNIVVSDELLTLLDEISDRMIITNYSLDFYKIYSKKMILNRTSVFEKQITLNDVDKLKNSSFFKNIKERIFVISNGALSEQDSDYIDQALSYMLHMSAIQLKGLHEMKKAFNSCLLYEFFEIATKIKLDTVLISPASDNILDSFKKQVIELAGSLNFEKYRSNSIGREMFYFSDFTEDEIRSCEKFKQLPISRFILKRLPDESVEDYIERYKEGFTNKSLNSLNSRDQFKLLLPLIDYFVFIIGCANVYELEYSSFSEGMFINGLINICTQVLDKPTAMQVLGIPQSLLNLIKKNTVKIDRQTFNPDIFEFNTKMLMVNYSDNLMKYINKERQLYESISMQSDNCISDYFDKYNFMRTINTILSNIAVLSDNDSDERLDEEDVRNEFYNYASYYDDFTQMY